MRKDLFDSLIMGLSIAFVVLAIRTLADGAAEQIQLLMLLAAGVALAGLQLALTLRRARRRGHAGAQWPEPGQPAPRPRRDQRNPFVRELTREWTGLDEHVIERSAAPAERTAADPAGQLDGRGPADPSARRAEADQPAAAKPTPNQGDGAERRSHD
jgi:hypothetical protein